MIVRYVRDFNKNPVACLVLIGDKIGWSACNWKKGEIFNKKIALRSAIERAKIGYDYNVPIFLQNIIPEFLNNPKHSFFMIDEFDVRSKRVKPTQIFQFNIINRIIDIVSEGIEDDE